MDARLMSVLYALLDHRLAFWVVTQPSPPSLPPSRVPKTETHLNLKPNPTATATTNGSELGAWADLKNRRGCSYCLSLLMEKICWESLET